MSGSEVKDTPPAGSTRTLRSALLRKQPEIEEVDEEDTSPDSDQSSTTITAGTDTQQVSGESAESVSPEDDLKPSPPSHKHNHISPKLKQLTRSEALCEECASPPLDPLKSTASTCSSDSSSSGIGTKSSFTSGSISGSSFHGRLEKDGSQSSEAGTSSSLSRDSSVDTPYKDSTGIDLEDFIKKTLNKTPKDRSMLIKLEVDLIKFIREPKHHYLKFPQMSSYDRMLVHRIAAFFGLDHNVDQTGKCVIVNKTANTRIPDFTFQEHISNGDESKPKKLLQRGGGSYDELSTRSLQKPSLDATRAKSLEERQQEYEEVRSRIFTGHEQADAQPTGYCQEDPKITGIVKKIERPISLGSKDENPWSSTESSGYGSIGSGEKVARILVPKANSFGGTGTFVLHSKSPMRGSSLSKADDNSADEDSLSMGASMIQPNYGSFIRPYMMSSPTCSQSEASSLTGSSSGLAPSPQQQQQQQGNTGQKVYWVASDLNSIPAGSVVINPQTGMPFVNPDGSAYKYMPGQPLPQPVQHYPQGAQPQVYQVQQQQQDWTTQISQESQSSQDVCQQLSVMRLTPQSSVDSTGAGGDNSASAASQQQQQQQQPQMIINQNVQPGQQVFTPQQMSGGQSQGMFYPATAGQHPVRYMCSYGMPSSGVQSQQGFTPMQGMQVEGNNQGQQYPAHQYCQQYIQGFQGNQMYPMTSQGQTIGQGQSDVNFQCGYSVTSPVEGQTGQGSNGYNYPVPFSQQQQTVVAPNQSPMYYTVQNQQSTQAPVQQGYVYSGQQGTTYQTNTPPSQNSTVTPNVQLNTVGAQPVNLNNMNMASAVNIASQQTQGIVQGSAVVGGGVQAQNTQYMSSFQTSHPNMHHSQHYHHPQSFTSPIRPVAPQVLPIQGVPVGNTAPAQTFQSVYRPNMQMPMQIHHQQPHVQQQQTTMVGSAVSKPVQTPTQHVTVSAKGLSFESSPGVGKVENGGGESCESLPVEVQMANTVYRPHAPSQGEIRLQYQPHRPQVQTVQFPHQQQPQANRSSPTAPKPQRTKKLRSRDSQQSQQSDTGSGNGMVISNVLEVCDLPNLLARADYEKILHDLIVAGADIQFSTADSVLHLSDIHCNNQTISSPNTRVYAVFADSYYASQALDTHSNSNSNYKLRPIDNISDSHV
ncbi:cAMP-regulated phosphoprotein 21-like isoform X3 [Ruditapes philippinarum]|nr:cAMP-regulated phosphoprotein 21-like isoform X3 [Ruditapes philippinarum]XP_060585639.1 cAMP-regulated phosphoprotein 21-like isoform X3 [Ruditapes philippinarum]